MSTTVSPSAHICEGVRIGSNVVIEDDVYIDNDVIIRDNVYIKKKSFIGARCILGEYTSDFFKTHTMGSHELIIGENALIRSESIIYTDCIIGTHFSTGHRVTIREQSKIGSHVRIGTLSDIQGHCVIEDYASLHSNVHIGQASHVGKYTWIYPYVVLTNDPNPPSVKEEGVTVEDFAVVATGSIVLPGKRIGRDALVGAGAIVTRNVPEGKVFVGNPARELCDAAKIIDRETGKPMYPWRYNFDRGMPWEGSSYDEFISTLHHRKDAE